MKLFVFRHFDKAHIGTFIFGLWNVFIVGIVTYTTFVIPFSIAIGEPFYAFAKRELFLTVIYTADIVISLIRIRRKASFMHIEYNAMKSFYRRWIITDIIAALPLAQLLGMPLLQVFRLAKSAKVIFLTQVFRRVMANYSNPILLMQILYWVMIATHCLACGWLLMRGMDHDTDIRTNYIEAVYWTTATLTTVGYGDITPNAPNERIYAIFTMLIGYSLFGYLIGSVAGILAKRDPVREMYNENLEKLTSAARYANLPLELQRRIYEYFRYQMSRRVGYDEEGFLKNLPPSLRGEVSLYFRKEVLENVALFEDAPQAFMFEIAQQLREQIIAPDEYVFKAGDPGRQMFLIAHGIVDVYNTDETKHLRTLSEGDHFGEVALFHDIPRTATVKANTYCDLYLLNKQTFERTLSAYPTIAERIKEKAELRFKDASTE